MSSISGMTRARTRIGPDGSVINDDDEDNGGGGGAGGSSAGTGVGRLRRYCRMPRRIDTFGFSLELRHFALVLLFVSVTGGRVGLALFAFFLATYSHYQRRYSSSSSSSFGGGGGRWKDGKAVGSNIKGVGDLPKPKGG